MNTGSYRSPAWRFVGSPGVQGSWSLSERFLQNHLSFLDALQRHLDQLATTCRYS
ncbi:hypothetical protein AK812_SmicGene46400, partial [Symbiodinium microadriaticum]